VTGLYFSLQSRTALAFAVALSAVLCQGASEQGAQSKEAQAQQAQQSKGLPTRASPAEYQARVQVGAITIGADFDGHSITSPQSVLNTEDYVVVEVGLFGPPDARLSASYEDFSVRINGKKALLAAQPYAMIFGSLKDPDWAPPTPPESKSKTSLGGGGGQNDPGSPPPVVHIPIEVERAMQLRVQKASLPGGERVLPEAGLIFFRYAGKTKGIHSMDLLYAGAAGKATLKLIE
jgi:hypothetical protein